MRCGTGSARAAAALLGLGLLTGVAAAVPEPEIRVVNKARLPPGRIDALMPTFQSAARRVFSYLRADAAMPVTLVLTRRVRIGLYVGDRILMPPDDDREDMEETWIHELTHHVTGHDSTYFFKEGIATHVTEKLFVDDGRMPAGWPQYAAGNDAWVRLYRACGERLPLAQAMAWPGYDGTTPTLAFRSWQVYVMAGSFARWYVDRYGVDAYLRAFRAGRTPQPVADLEQAWLSSLAEDAEPLPDPAALLPDTPRFRPFVTRLSACP